MDNIGTCVFGHKTLVIRAITFTVFPAIFFIHSNTITYVSVFKTVFKEFQEATKMAKSCQTRS